VSECGPGREFLDALARELRVGWRYRRRVIAELADHLDEAVERERRLGAGAEEAERVAIRRLGAVGVVADRLVAARREAVALARERALGTLVTIVAALVVACASVARAATGDSDAHLGVEAAAAIAGAVAVLLTDACPRASRRVGIALVGVIAVLIAAATVVASDGDVTFCGLTLLGVGGIATVRRCGRRLRWRPGRSEY
jgi:hypothetical protein